MNASTLLWAILALPVGGALTLLAIPKDDAPSIRLAAFFWSLITFFASLPLFWAYDQAGPVFQLVSEHAWLPQIGASFKIGIDGIALLLILLTTFIVPLTIIASWRSIEERVKEFHVALLVLESSMIGVFVARDLLLFYLFWEAMLVPMFLLIGVWGSKGRVRAAVKFFIYTAVGSLLMLAAVLYVYHQVPGGSFDLDRIEEVLRAKRASGELTARAQLWLFLGFALAFAIKVPLFPLHTWLPHAHVEAPAAGSVILAAVMLKMGGYGFVRLAIPFFPAGAQSAAPVFIALAAAGVVYGALMALSQSDVKRLIAYSSVSHLALVVLGLFVFQEHALAGSVYQMVSHGLTTGALFLLVGAIYERRHTREMSELGGIAWSAPKLATCFVIATFGSIALPATSGFVGELLIIIGAFQAKHPYAAAIGASGALLGAAYMLIVVRRVFFGEAHGENAHVEDLDGREMAYLAPVLAMIVVLGIFPTPFLGKLDHSVQRIVEQARSSREG